MSEIFSFLSRERAKRYRAQAGEIRAKAAQYPGEIRTAFFRIAEYWEQLALEAEARYEKEAAAGGDRFQKNTPPGPAPLPESDLAEQSTKKRSGPGLSV